VENMKEIWNYRERMAVEEMLSRSIIGSKKTVEQKLLDFEDETKADEIMIISHVYDEDERLKSYEIFSEIMQGK
ncbi:MAG TPA: LLM class flavin-dependent oxidoreductase, partial [Balneolaceae bacterium]|nr:LLM class flavin-dependent oxidoreductase [Balneolaceae bacterium]